MIRLTTPHPWAIALALVAALGVPAAIVAPSASALAATSTCHVTNTTTHTTGNNLFHAMTAASKGQTLKIAGTCVGDYKVTKVLTFKAAPTGGTLKSYGDRTLLISTSPGAGTVKFIGLHITGGTAFTCPQYSGYACGGGIYNTGKVLLQGVTLTGNKADSSNLAGDGGGIFNAPGATMTITGSTISNNRAGSPAASFGAYAGGIDNEGTMTISRSTITGNVADAGGSANSEAGGILDYQGHLTISDSTVSNNLATHDASPPESTARSSSGGGIVDDGGTLTVLRSTVNGNLARAHGNAQGGGVLAFSGTVSLSNVTISGNHATLNGSTAGGTVSGAGIADLGASSFTITDSTVSLNVVTDATHAASQATGGGIYSSGAPLTKSSIIAGNAAKTAIDCAYATSAGSGGHNLIGTGTGCGGSFVNGTKGDKVGSNAHKIAAGLGALASNGGPTKTQALLSGSPAINMAGGSPCATSTDQRGVARPQGPACDAGAFEKQ
jgi:hypothetical protein